MYSRTWIKRCVAPGNGGPLGGSTTVASATAGAALKGTAEFLQPGALGGTSSSTAAATAALNHDLLLKRYESWLHDQRIDLTKLDILKMNPTTGRGLFAKKRILPGETLVSVPMYNLALNATSLLQYSPAVQKAEPPQLDVVKRNLMVRGVRDPVLFQLMHLSMLITAERNDPNSFFGPYFDVLPYPAVDDKVVMSTYKGILDAPAILEWGEQRQEFGILCKKLADAWGDKCPHPVLLDWAWRTTLGRQHMLPDRGLTPSSTLHYSALHAYKSADSVGLTAALRRFGKRFTNKLPMSVRQATGIGSLTADDEEEYRLVPTLVPILDQLGHVSSSNVSVEVVPRGDAGSCAELHALTEIQPGEEVGICFSRAHSVAFTLYRFGFIPM